MSTLKVGTIQNTSGVEVYTCKAWVNFNGTGTVAIRASGNVSSITDNGTGDYTVNFATALADTNYVTNATGCDALGGASGQIKIATSGGFNGTLLTYSTTQVRLGNSAGDFTYLGVSIFR